MDIKKIPTHVAIIMDGNGRWAAQRTLPRVAGHEAGARAVRTVVEASREIGIRYLTLYAFSQENWGRPTDEVTSLWHLLGRFLEQEEPLLQKHEIRLTAIGRLDKLPSATVNALNGVCQRTRAHDKMTLTLALSYGSRDEICDAVNRIAQAAIDGTVKLPISPEILGRYLYTHEMPDPDLIIRTSGELRLSNFLLWQAAYSELYVTNTLWPDFDRNELRSALEAYALRERRFGKVAVNA